MAVPGLSNAVSGDRTILGLFRIEEGPNRGCRLNLHRCPGDCNRAGGKHAGKAQNYQWRTATNGGGKRMSLGSGKDRAGGFIANCNGTLARPAPGEGPCKPPLPQQSFLYDRPQRWRGFQSAPSCRGRTEHGRRSAGACHLDQVVGEGRAIPHAAQAAGRHAVDGADGIQRAPVTQRPHHDPGFDVVGDVGHA